MDDRSEIAHLIYEYCLRLDAGDFVGFAELFANGVWEYPGSFELQGSEAVRSWLEENIRLYDGNPLTSHVTTNVIIDVDENGGAASSKSYLTVFQAVPPDLPFQAIFSARYVDAFSKRGDVWTFMRRTIIAKSSGDLRFHMAGLADSDA